MEHSIAMICIYALLALSFMIVLRVGEVSFGQQAFFAFGAYSSAIATAMFEVSLPIAFAIAIIIGFFVAWMVSYLVLRLYGVNFSLFMLVFAEITRDLFSQWTWQLNGSNGLVGPEGSMGFARIDFFARAGLSGEWQLFILCSITVSIFIFVNWLLQNEWGLRVVATSVDRELAELRGINTKYVRRTAFILAGGCASISGALFAHYVTFIYPSNFGLMTGVHALAYTLIGGTGHVLGSLAGTVFDVWLLEWLRFAGPYRMVIFGSVIVIALIIAPSGIVSNRAVRRDIKLWGS